MLRPIAHPVACCCTEFETSQLILEPLTPNISFVPCSATMLDPFTQLFQHCRGHACVFLMVYKVLWVVFFPRCTVGPTNVGNYCIHMHTTAETDATTPNIVGPAMLCWEFLRPFVRSLSPWFGFRAGQHFKIN